jgi:N-glycosidase YbiA
MQPEIKGFFGHYRFLSNFWFVKVELDGVTYPTVEHAYQAAKTHDFELRKGIIPLKVGEAKKWGRQVVIREDWEDVKDDIMFDLCAQKFAKEPLRTCLLATGESYLEETNHWGDKYWGVCNGVGLNKLGLTLMRIRQFLKELD